MGERVWDKSAARAEWIICSCYKTGNVLPSARHLFLKHIFINLQHALAGSDTEAAAS